jgi:hypothetical protein
MRIDVLTGPDDDVLDPAGDEEIAAGHVGAVAGVQPAVVEQLARLGWILEIARGRRRPGDSTGPSRRSPSSRPVSSMIRIS